MAEVRRPQMEVGSPQAAGAIDNHQRFFKMIFIFNRLCYCFTSFTSFTSFHIIHIISPLDYNDQHDGISI